MDEDITPARKQGLEAEDFNLFLFPAVLHLVVKRLLLLLLLLLRLFSRLDLLLLVLLSNRPLWATSYHFVCHG